MEFPSASSVPVCTEVLVFTYLSCAPWRWTHLLIGSKALLWSAATNGFSISSRTPNAVCRDTCGLHSHCRRATLLLQLTCIAGGLLQRSTERSTQRSRWLRRRCPRRWTQQSSLLRPRLCRGRSLSGRCPAGTLRTVSCAKRSSTSSIGGITVASVVATSVTNARLSNHGVQCQHIRSQFAIASFASHPPERCLACQDHDRRVLQMRRPWLVSRCLS